MGVQKSRKSIRFSKFSLNHKRNLLQYLQSRDNKQNIKYMTLHIRNLSDLQTHNYLFFNK